MKATLTSAKSWGWCSRAELWRKGATSGHTQRVVEVRLDCDGDALTVLVEPRGPACHTGARTCFHRQLAGSAAAGPAASDKPGENDAMEDFGAVVAELFALVEGRRREMPENSYTTYLFGQGLNKILKKVGEAARTALAPPATSAS